MSNSNDLPLAEDYIKLDCPHCGKPIEPELVNSAWHTAIISAGHARKANRIAAAERNTQLTALRKSIDDIKRQIEAVEVLIETQAPKFDSGA